MSVSAALTGLIRWTLTSKNATVACPCSGLPRAMS